MGASALHMGRSDMADPRIPFAITVDPRSGAIELISGRDGSRLVVPSDVWALFVAVVSSFDPQSLGAEKPCCELSGAAVFSSISDLDRAMGRFDLRAIAERQRSKSPWIDPERERAACIARVQAGFVPCPPKSRLAPTGLLRRLRQFWLRIRVG